MNGSTLFAHIVVVNREPKDIEAYWWTNIGVPWKNKSNQTRVIAPCPYAIYSSKYGLRPQEFPMTDDCGYNPAEYTPTDHRYEIGFFWDGIAKTIKLNFGHRLWAFLISYPSHFGTDRDYFLRPPPK